MDYRKFLGKQEELVLPYFGGSRLDAGSRRFRFEAPPLAPGWYRFQVSGRKATVVGPAEAPSLDDLPRVRGHFLSGRVVRDGAIAEALWLLPEEEPPRFSPVTARRWHSGELLFEALEFEGEAEEAVRLVAEEGSPLAEVKGAAASLRAAYAYSILETASGQLGIPASKGEVRGHVAAVANGGRQEAERVLRLLAQERELARREQAELEHRRQAFQVAEEARHERERREAQAQRLRDEAPERAERALEAAGARMASARVLGGGNLEVIFTFLDERFISVVNAATLQVVDSGICLGHPPRDELITLESLPSVIKEAIDTHQLVILRHA